MPTRPLTRPFRWARAFGPPRGGRTVLLLDTFTDTDTTALADHTMDVGDGWTVAAGGEWTIQGGRGQLVKTINSRDFAWADAGAADVTVRATVRPGGTGNTPGVSVRVTDANNGWHIRVHPAGDTFSIFERNAGTFTERAVKSFTIDAATDYTITVVTRGQTITAYLNGGNVITYASAALNTTTTTHGLHDLNDAGVTTDTFERFEVFA